MWVLLGAVISASLLGSMHCVGMCGPLAIWAGGLGQRYPRAQMVSATTLYHLGRLVTYALVGLLAGLAGQLADFGGEILGFQLAAARVAGALMILFGILQLLSSLGQGKVLLGNRLTKPSLMAAWLVRLRPNVLALPLTARALATGLLTALLPCGWLYLFALAASGTGNAILGSLLMVAFWFGSVPALVGLVAATRVFASRFQTFLPSLAATGLIVAGFYMTAGRGFSQLQTLTDIRPALIPTGSNSRGVAAVRQRDAESIYASVAGEIHELAKTPLPCCHEN